MKKDKITIISTKASRLFPNPEDRASVLKLTEIGKDHRNVFRVEIEATTGVNTAKISRWDGNRWSFVHDLDSVRLEDLGVHGEAFDPRHDTLSRAFFEPAASELYQIAREIIDDPMVCDRCGRIMETRCRHCNCTVCHVSLRENDQRARKFQRAKLASGE